MSKDKWPKRFAPVADYIKNYLRYEPTSPTGLAWKNPPNRWVQQDSVAGTRNMGGWTIALLGKSYSCSHIVLMLNGCFPNEGQVCRHLDGDEFNNSLKNLKWVKKNEKDRAGVVGSRITNCTKALDRERANVKALREWLEVDPTSKTGLRWKKSKLRVRKGAEAGCLTKQGDYRTVFQSVSYSNARLVLILSYYTPDVGQVVEHLDGNAQNNALENLRWTTREALGRKIGGMTSPNYPFALLVNDSYRGRYRSKQGQWVVVGTYDTPWEANEAALKHKEMHDR